MIAPRPASQLSAQLIATMLAGLETSPAQQAQRAMTNSTAETMRAQFLPRLTFQAIHSHMPATQSRLIALSAAPAYISRAAVRTCLGVDGTVVSESARAAANVSYED